MTYLISEVAKKLGITIHTLRYYDKEGLLPFVERSQKGVRKFKDSDIEAIKIIQCLKVTGMPIKEIKEFIGWSIEGDSTLQKRYTMFLERKAAAKAQLEELNKTMEVILYKCEYFERAVEAGTEEIYKNKKLISFN
ncbi:MerR family transcriptional regulator [Halalkalibacter hemicellulosilyticus]|uniref:Transcriptional regulator n=1 Tax=Halalkalibacter hemicellulosilyticusJCM 9152 TaxID=1236971 RepID=W4QDN7_9BACI|nr:MerR family transcriptional regulator [Halalkalibacter hemicellulosilyticus]GAE30176.1 transcriptional regulator [Halalkalibacter hemicellulosilyticusJCM 9152]